MRKLYATYTDEHRLELWVPDTFTLWPDGVRPGGQTQPLGWKTDDGYEGWLDPEGLRFLSVVSTGSEADETKAAENAGIDPAALAAISKGLVPERPSTAHSEPRVLQGGPVNDLACGSIYQTTTDEKMTKYLPEFLGCDRTDNGSHGGLHHAHWGDEDIYWDATGFRVLPTPADDGGLTPIETGPA